MEIREKLHKKEVIYNFLKEDSLTNKEKNILKNISRYLKKFKKDLEKLQKKNIIILHMAQITYLMKSMKKTIMNQQKSGVLLMVVIYFMKAEEIKTLNQRWTNIFTKLDLI